MPGYKGHLAFGCGIYALLALVVYGSAVSLQALLRGLLMLCAGALFPDIDVKSKGQKIFYSLFLFALLVLIAHNQLSVVAVCSIIATVPLMSKHRGIFHNAWFIVILSAMIFFILHAYAPYYASLFQYDIFFFVVGALSHLWLDMGLYRMFRVYAIKKLWYKKRFR